MKSYNLFQLELQLMTIHDASISHYTINTKEVVVPFTNTGSTFQIIQYKANIKQDIVAYCST